MRAAVPKACRRRKDTYLYLLPLAALARHFDIFLRREQDFIKVSGTMFHAFCACGCDRVFWAVKVLQGSRGTAILRGVYAAVSN